MLGDQIGGTFDQNFGAFLKKFSCTIFGTFWPKKALPDSKHLPRYTAMQGLNVHYQTTTIRQNGVKK